MSEPFAGAGFDGEACRGPRQIINAMIEQGRQKTKGLLPYVNALSFARRHGWRDLEAELFARVGVLLARSKETLDDAAAEALAQEASETSLTDEVHVALRALLAAVRRCAPGAPGLLRLAAAFESKADVPIASSAAWQARLMAGGFLDGLRGVDPTLAEQARRRLTGRVSDWVIEYHLTEAAPDLELRTRATFGAILAAAWSERAPGNVASGLDSALLCAVDRLTRTAAEEWFEPFVSELTPKVAVMTMHRRLTRETLYRVGELLGAARREIYRAKPDAAIAVSTLEEAIHRPHRRQLSRTPMKLELELPGPRGFGRGTRLRVFDISRDGCLAVTEGPAHFQETAASALRLERAGGRAFDVRRLSGVLRQGSVEWDVRPETALVLHDASRASEWAAIDGASVVRVTSDRATDRLWVGFHFDRVVPEVQQEIEALVYGAA